MENPPSIFSEYYIPITDIVGGRLALEPELDISIMNLKILIF